MLRKSKRGWSRCPLRGAGNMMVRFLCLVVLFGAPSSGQIPSFEGRPIVDIQYSPAPPLDPADLARVQPLKKGESLRAAAVARAIDSLYGTGHFEDIVVEAEPSGAGVIVRFVLKNRRFVGGISTPGKLAFPPTHGEIKNASQLNLGTPFHDADVTAGVERIKRLLEANGLYEAEVTPVVRLEQPGDRVLVAFHVKENKRAKYEMPLITGHPGLPDATIVRATGWRIRFIRWWRQVTDARTRSGLQGVQGKYQSQDRLTAQVQLEKLDYDSQHRRVRPTLNIEPDPKVKVKAVEAKVSRRVLKRYVPVFEQRAVNNELLVRGQRNLRDYFQGKGYYDVDVQFRVQPVQNDVETIEYVIALGQRQKLVRLAFAGNKYFRSEAAVAGR